MIQLLNLADDILDRLAAAQSSEEFNGVLNQASQILAARTPRVAATAKAHGMVTLTIQGEVSEAVEQKIRSLAGESDFESFPDGENTIVKIGPVQDVQKLADRIDFGTVKEVDLQKRLIKVVIISKAGTDR